MPVRDFRRRTPPVALCRAHRRHQGDALLGLASINWLKLILTYCVPYVVCTYGAVSYRLRKADVTLERSA
jgi:hypothetical protein